MSAVPSIVLVDLASNEKHLIDSPESILGRNWLQCDDKRISRTHGILKILSETLVSVQATHQNQIFYRKKDETQVQPIKQNQEVNLNVGDSFGLLVDKFWFRVQKMDVPSVPEMNGSTNKRRTGSESEPDSTNKRVKTEPDEFQTNGDEPSNGDTTVVLANDDDANGVGAVANSVADQATNSQQPSTSGTSSANDNGTCQCYTRIKTEPIDLDGNEAQPMQTTDEIVIKVEPDIEQNCCHCSSNVQIKTEVKEEPTGDGDGEATSSNDALASGGTPVEAVAADNNQSNDDQPANQQAQQPARRDCCRYGIRCYRRNPIHRNELAHPGDTDYRLPDYPDPPLGTPQCPFLDRCYRRHPMHFQQFSHKANLRPGDDKKKAGYEATATEPNRTANRPNYANNGGGDDDDDEEEDPFHTDEDSDPDFNDGYSSPDSDDMPGFRNM